MKSGAWNDSGTALSSCRLCPRVCGADRINGKRGWCGAGAHARVALAALHRGEEPPISGERGSGTVFFSHCNMRCVFCQNHEISWGGKGRELTPVALAGVFLDLQAQGAHNINLVSPTPYVPQIAAALRLAVESGLAIPVVYNSNAYELPETLDMLAGLVQIFLPDLKYAEDELARAYSDCPAYFGTAGAALRAMRRLAPRDLFAADGTMQSGLILRHLVLPGHAQNTAACLEWIAENLGPATIVSLMAQYTPMHRAAGHPVLGRALARAEYEEALSIMDRLGLEHGYAQELSSSSPEFVPDFDLTGLP